MTNGKRIVDVLRHCAAVHDCTGCSYGCDTNGLPRNRDLLNDAADAIEELLAAVPKWISVEERLPETDDFVIVAILDERGDTPYQYTDFGWYLDVAKCWIVNAEQRRDVTHWMPLPKAPKEVE